MREADMKCKVAACLLPTFLSESPVQAASLLHFPALAGRLTRSRKVAAEDAFRCQFVHSLWRSLVTLSSTKIHIVTS